MLHLLLLHGNGGTRTRFIPFLEVVSQQENAPFQTVIPELPGFDGRPIPDQSWEAFVEPLQRAVLAAPDAQWVFYGHGIGGSILLEWAARGWAMPDGTFASPQRVLLHGCIGASLEHRFFPKLMQPRPIRWLIQRLITFPLLQPLWERKLFQVPARIPKKLRRQFFEDYRSCRAFPVFFDLITPQWYRRVQQQLSQVSFWFIWGEQERVVASKHLSLWKADFPKAQFHIVPDWDHFPMLEQPQAFYEVLLGLLPVDQPPQT